MIPAAFDYVRPPTLAAAIAALKQHGSNAKLMAGGHSLLPMMKLRFATPDVLIDVNELNELKGISVSEAEVTIGAVTTHATLEHHGQIATSLPLITLMAPLIADATVRNRGTLGGAIVHSDPTADWPAAMLALDAGFDLGGADGGGTLRKRSWSRRDFGAGADSAAKGCTRKLPQFSPSCFRVRRRGRRRRAPHEGRALYRRPDPRPRVFGSRL